LPDLIFPHSARKFFYPWHGFKTDSRSGARDGPCRTGHLISDRAAVPRSPLYSGGAAATALPIHQSDARNAQGNETSFVAFLSPDALDSFGQKMKQNRLKLRKTRKQMALESGVSPKTLWGWETDRWQPTAADDGTFF